VGKRDVEGEKKNMSKRDVEREWAREKKEASRETITR